MMPDLSPSDKAAEWGTPPGDRRAKGQPHHRGGACAPGLAGVLAPAPHPNFGPWTLDLRLRTAAPANWPSLPRCGAKRPCRSSGLRRGCRSARPKGPSPCSLIWLRAKTNAKPQAPSNHAPSSYSNLRLTHFQLDTNGGSIRCQYCLRPPDAPDGLGPAAGCFVRFVSA